MDNYRWMRPLAIETEITFANPQVDIGVQAAQLKSHLNRFIGCVEDLPDTIRGAGEAAATAVCKLAEAHPALAHEVRMRAAGGTRMGTYVTGALMTQELDLFIGAKLGPPAGAIDLKFGGVKIDADPILEFTFGFRTPVHTVCPFMLYEAGGHSHTQRTYLKALITTPIDQTAEANGFILSPIIKTINDRMTPSMSRMKIPDEAVNVLRAYTTPTYTEFGAAQLLSIIRDTKKGWSMFPERPSRVSIEVRSLESIFANDILSTLVGTV